MLLMIHWNADPVLVEIPLGFATIALRWYGVMFVSGFFYGLYWMRRRYREAGLPDQKLEPLLLYVMIATIAGARLGHVLFYEPQNYLREPWRILAIWEGGLASHGGAVAVILALLLYSRRQAIDFWWLIDRLVIPAALTGALIRIGNLFNSEIIGRPTDVPWAFVFERVDPWPRHPAQLYESMAYFVTFVVLLMFHRSPALRDAKRFLFGVFLTLVFAARFVIEFFKEHQVAFEDQLPLAMGQLLSVPFIAIGVWMIARSLRKAPA